MTDSNGLAIRTVTGMDLPTLGQVLVSSGFFKDTRDQAQAIVKVLAGGELGFGPIASMQGIYIVEGKISLSAQLIASAIQKSGKYRYRVKAWTEDGCRIAFFEGAELLGEFAFDMEDAKRANLAGKGPWRSYPKAMLWARAMSGGARAFCPEVFNGAIYTPEELGAEVDEEGRVLHPPADAPVVVGAAVEQGGPPFPAQSAPAAPDTVTDGDYIDEAPPFIPPNCEDCNQPVEAYTFAKTGDVMSAREVVERSQKAFGKDVCFACAMKRRPAKAGTR